MKRKILACSLFIAIGAAIGSVGLLTLGCSKTKVQVPEAHPVIVVTNGYDTLKFNDEHYVWENFYFSTNKVEDTKLNK